MISYLIEQHGDIILVPREDAQLAALEKDEAAAQSAEADIEAGGETIEEDQRERTMSHRNAERRHQDSSEGP